jgi:hypothetical protein
MSTTRPCLTPPSAATSHADVAPSQDLSLLEFQDAVHGTAAGALSANSPPSVAVEVGPGAWL